MANSLKNQKGFIPVGESFSWLYTKAGMTLDTNTAGAVGARSVQRRSYTGTYNCGAPLSFVGTAGVIPFLGCAIRDVVHPLPSCVLVHRF